MGRNTNDLRYRFCPFRHLAPEMNDIRLAGNTIDFSSGSDYCRNVVLTVVFNVEQIEMGLYYRYAEWVVIEPFFGSEDRSRDAFTNEKFNEVIIVFSGTGIES